MNVPTHVWQAVERINVLAERGQRKRSTVLNCIVALGLGFGMHMHTQNVSVALWPSRNRKRSKTNNLFHATMQWQLGNATRH